MSVISVQPKLMPGDHVVHFYRDDADLAGTVGAHLATALAAGEIVIAIATRPHLDALFRALTATGKTRMATSPRLILLDAADTLAKLTGDGNVSREAFDREIGRLVRAARSDGSPVAAYGEMVDLLWQAGNVEAALELERLWNDLISDLGFSLLCAYQSEAVAGPEQAHALHEVCHLHSSVLREVSREFAPEGGAPQAARCFLGEALERWGYSGARIEDARLLISELVTNAVIHARSPLLVSISSAHPNLRLLVRDQSPTEPALSTPVPGRPSGRGLHIVAALSRDWGVDATPDGKTVWAEL